MNLSFYLDISQAFVARMSLEKDGDSPYIPTALRLLKKPSSLIPSISDERRVSTCIVSFADK